MKIKAVASLVVLLVAVAGCGAHKTITTRAGGHDIHLVVAGNPSLDTHPDQGVLSSQYGRITIEKARARVDDAPWSAIPEGVPVEAEISKGRVSVTAGGVSIRRTKS